ncbi:hypothetical protein PENSPDRAFT_693537 [Peniophora sp. CONT]|nr:hypothetical protein PENSPDRAFT_693537 [Peniophora sp. CONT]
MRCGYLLLALAAFVIQLSKAASLPVRPTAPVAVAARCPKMFCRIEDPASAVTPTATFVPAAMATAVDSAFTPAASATAVPSASAQPVTPSVTSLRAFLAAFVEAFKTAVSAAMQADDDARANAVSSDTPALTPVSSDSQENATSTISLEPASIKRRAVSLKTFSHRYRVGIATPPSTTR